LKSAYLLQATQALVPKAIKEGTLEPLRKKQSELTLELLRNLIDVPIPLTGLSAPVARVIPTGIVGLCGMISSLIGIYQAYGKTK
jgi:hypothetical protein